MGDEQFDPEVVPWADRDRRLEAKLRRLYEQHLDSWIGMQGNRKFEQKWHVGREILNWFYDQHLINADEFEALILGDKVRLGFEAPREVTIHRKEVYDRIQRDQRQENEETPTDSKSSD
jgi:carbon storage regulator CsrA